MSYRRRNAGVICHDGLLFVVGGDDGSANLSNVEVSINSFFFLHQMRNTWSLMVYLLSFVSGLRDKDEYMAYIERKYGYWP